jgi:hypothetical protein
LARLPRINTDKRGSGTENLPPISTDNTDQEEQNPTTDKHGFTGSGEEDRVIARDREIGKARAKTYRGSTRINADQEDA